MAEWEAIKIEYITTNISQRQLAEKYGVPLKTLSHRSTTEGWVDKRKQHRDKVATKTLKAIAGQQSKKLEKLIHITSKAIDVAGRAFDDNNQFFRHLVDKRIKYDLPLIVEDDDGDGSKQAITERQWTEEEVFGKLDTKALKDVTAVLKDLTALYRDFFNIPTPAQAEAQRIAAERLELDKRKAAADNEASDIEVIFAAGPEEWNE